MGQAKNGSMGSEVRGTWKRVRDWLGIESRGRQGEMGVMGRAK